MVTELTEEDRALLEKCIANVLGRKVHKVGASDLVQILPDPTEALNLIKADKQAARLYVQKALRAAGLPDLIG